MRPGLLVTAGGVAAGGLTLWWLMRSPVIEAELPPVPDPPAPGPAMPVVISLDGEPTKTTATSLTAHLSDGFLRGVLALADRYRAEGATVQAEDFFAVFLGESPWQGKNINPAAISVTGCVGINQICPKRDRLTGQFKLDSVGWNGTIDEYRALTAEQQLPYAAKYFENALASVAKKPPSALRDAGDLYCLNFAPAYVGMPPSTRMTHLTPLQYRQNQGLDTGAKGYIDVADMGKYMQRVVARNPVFWKELTGRLAQLRTAVSGATDPTTFPLLSGTTVFGGDSITVGVFPYVKIDGEKIRIAKGGQSSTWLLAQLRSPEGQAALSRAKNLVVLIGTNDCGNAPSADTIIANIEAIWQEGKKHGLTVYAMTIPPFKGWQTYQPFWDDKRAKINAAIVASKTPDRVIRLDQLLADPSDPLRLAKGYDSPDHLHPRMTALGQLLSVELGHGPAPQGTAPAADDIEILPPEPIPVLAQLAAPESLSEIADAGPTVGLLSIAAAGVIGYLVLRK